MLSARKPLGQKVQQGGPRSDFKGKDSRGGAVGTWVGQVGDPGCSAQVQEGAISARLAKQHPLGQRNSGPPKPPWARSRAGKASKTFKPVNAASRPASHQLKYPVISPWVHAQKPGSWIPAARTRSDGRAALAKRSLDQGGFDFGQLGLGVGQRGGGARRPVQRGPEQGGGFLGNLRGSGGDQLRSGV